MNKSIKVKFTVFNAFITLLFVVATYFTIAALRADELNLNPLFAAVSFVLALGLCTIRFLIRYFFKDLKKMKIAESVLLVIGFLVFFFFCTILLDMMGIFSI